MPASLLIGLVIVVVGLIAARLTLFETRDSLSADPAAHRTLTVATAASPDTGPQPDSGGRVSTGLRAAVGVHRPTGRPSVNIRWYQRLRSALLLVLLAVGFGMAIGGVLGLAALLVSFVLG
ncbi:MAG: hypothetical protein GX868_12965 [Actinobacteria bacterium]|nr:hypothetical protein [Actinomycetota bacterium]